ncbi:hypothetical protein [Intrasporangium sp. DVR]|uniref:hypothetical protein n=1 Tax=Intrasporangium sp. DVR TaxID=3127867 RepID=UPI00313A68C8
MRNITTTMCAGSCVVSARPHLTNTLLAATGAEGQGTVVSFVAPADLRLDDRRVPGLDPAADVDLTAIYKTPDVARSRFGRPPV